MSEPIILIPLDGSERALAALPVAKVLGDVERASLRIFHVADRRPAAGELPPTLRLEEPALDDSTIDLSVGEPAAEILLMAGKIKPRLIVMCTHTAAKREKVLGSTAMNVVRNAACPVVLVAPEHRSKGFGTQLLEKAIRHLDDLQVPTIKLDATPQGKPIYEKLGFVSEYELERWTLRRTVVDESKVADRDLYEPMSSALLESILRADREVFGADRNFLLKDLYEDGPAFTIGNWLDGAVEGHSLG